MRAQWRRRYHKRRRKWIAGQLAAPKINGPARVHVPSTALADNPLLEAMSVANKNSTKSSRTDRKDKVSAHLRRLWGDIDVEDGKADFQVLIRPEDVRTAKRKDFGGCIFAQSCKRVTGSDKVAFYKSVAYIGMADEQGKPVVRRFVIPEAARKLIASFDRGQPVPENASYILKAPPKSRSFESERDGRRKRKLLQRERLALKIEGEMIESNRGVGRSSPGEPLVVDLSVRNGTGVVHFKLK